MLYLITLKSKLRPNSSKVLPKKIQVRFLSYYPSHFHVKSKVPQLSPMPKSYPKSLRYHPNIIQSSPASVKYFPSPIHIKY